MQLIELQKIFDIRYGNQFDLNKMSIEEEGIAFVGRTAKNNGVVAFVSKYSDENPFQKGLITVSLGGSILSAFVQPSEFYTAQNIVVLSPKKEMDIKEKIYYCLVISKNRFRYEAFGREANRTIKKMMVPKRLPRSISRSRLEMFDEIKKRILKRNYRLNTKIWYGFKYKELFDIKRGTISTRRGMINGKTPYVTTTTLNNGVSAFLNIEPNNLGNKITISCKGEVGDAFYQPVPYFSVNDVATLTPKFEMNSYIALFLTTLIRKEKFRYGFGRKWSMDRMGDSIIKLPINRNGKPDFSYMENFSKSLDYSRGL